MYRSPDGKDVWKLSAFFFFCRMSESTRAGRPHYPCSALDSETEGGEARIVGLKVQGPTPCTHMWLHREAKALR